MKQPKQPAPGEREGELTKFVLVADEDDDRRDHRRGGFLNPRYAAQWERVRWSPKVPVNGPPPGRITGHGWSPPFTVRRRDRVELVGEEREAAGARGTAGAFCAMLRQDGPGRWRISCWGADDTAYERTGMTRETAERVYESLRDHITLRTLFGRHGFRRW